MSLNESTCFSEFPDMNSIYNKQSSVIEFAEKQFPSIAASSSPKVKLPLIAHRLLFKLPEINGLQDATKYLQQL